ncbi:MAG: glycosyltransferase family 2 protein [Verrucomicrobia bacterium]|nr:glycosyltransferase family 2 protein [Verrucomicrobiota bacterium]
MKLSLLIPVLNEQENIEMLLQAVDTAFRGLPDTELELVFIDDGSKDGTFRVLGELSRRDSRVHAVRLSRNFGSHAALQAGFQYCTGDAAAYLAADLQDPPAVLCEMLDRWRAGYPIVWAQRDQRDEALSSRVFARVYYEIMRRFALPEMPPAGLDICMIDRRVINAIVEMREKNTALFGLILWSGFPQSFVGYTRQSRRRGKSRWTFAKKLKLVVDSLVAFSFAPIRLVTYLGIFFSMAGFAYGVFTVVNALMGRTGVQGWASLVTLIVGMSGIQLLMLGVVAEYLWRTFDESRGRPTFIVRETIGFEVSPTPPRQSIQRREIQEAPE